MTLIYIFIYGIYIITLISNLISIDNLTYDLMIFATKCLLIQHFNCLDYFPMTSIYLYCEYHYWAYLGTWPLYLYYISRYVQVVSLSTNSLLVCISEEFYVLSYPHLRIVGEGPLQRATLHVSVLNQHRDVTSVSVVPCPFLLIMVV